MSLVRQRYAEECEAAINRQINMELYASYVYLVMSQHFDREDVALPGFRKYFAESSKSEREHAIKFMKYQNMRGGRIVYKDVAAPQKTEWSSGLEAMEAALLLEKEVNKSLLELHDLADSKQDKQLCDFLESNFLEEQVEDIKQIADYITNLRRVGPGVGEYMFDKETLHGESS